MATAERRRAPGPVLARQAWHDARVRTAIFAWLFLLYAYVQPAGYRRSFPTLDDRLVFAHGVGQSAGLALLYGHPVDLLGADGYAAWRVGGVLALAAGAFGVLAAVRALRAEEDAGRTELVLAGVVGRRTANLAALTAIGAAVGLLWLAEWVGLLLGGLDAVGSMYLALATASVAVVFAAIGALVAQLAPSRGAALAIGGAFLAVFFALRAIPDIVGGAVGWLRWLTPLGWAEEMRPFTGARPWVLALPLLTAATLLVVAVRIACDRDIGTGLLRRRDRAAPRLWLLSSPTAHALRSQAGAICGWTLAVGMLLFVFGAVADSISSADVSQQLQDQIAKLGIGSITTANGFLGFLFLFVVVAIVVFACTQVGAARQEEAEHLEAVLAQPVSRTRWLGGRLLLTLAAAALVAMAAGLFAWAGATVAGADVALPRLLGAGANALPITVLFSGIAALAAALAPRQATTITYGLVTVAFVWQLVGSLLAPPRWLLDITPFAHVGLLPEQPFRAAAAAIMVGLGIAAALAALVAFRQRDIVGT